MTRLQPSELAAFARRFRFTGVRVRRVRTRAGTDAVVELVLAVRPGSAKPTDDVPPVRLKLRVVGAEEFRFQKRPTVPLGRPADARFGYFDGLVFVNLDAYPLGAGEVPKAFDFRASDAYVAGRELWWELLPAKG